MPICRFTDGNVDDAPPLRAGDTSAHQRDEMLSDSLVAARGRTVLARLFGDLDKAGQSTARAGGSLRGINLKGSGSRRRLLVARLLQAVHVIHRALRMRGRRKDSPLIVLQNLQP